MNDITRPGSGDQITARKPEGLAVGVTGKDDLPDDEMLGRGRDAAVVKSMRDRLASRSKAAFDKGRRMFRIGVYVINLLILVAVVVVCTWGYKAYSSDNFYTSRLTDERGCRVKVGEDYVLGRRYYSYRYTDLLGYRFIDTKQIEERTELFVRASGYTIVGILPDNTSWSSFVDIGETGVEPLEHAETYTVFSKGKVGVVTYEGFCSQKNPVHPNATITD